MADASANEKAVVAGMTLGHALAVSAMWFLLGYVLGGKKKCAV